MFCCGHEVIYIIVACIIYVFFLAHHDVYQRWIRLIGCCEARTHNHAYAEFHRELPLMWDYQKKKQG